MFTSKSEVVEGKVCNVLFLITASGSTYDLVDVNVEVETKVFNAFSNKGTFHELQILGNNNVVKGLKLEDVGLKSDFPQYGCVNIVVDGAHNLVEGVELRSRGSMPYGYGEVFGKGKVKTMSHKKHSGLLVRGDFNHVKNCTVIHHAYGHFVFMQGATNPTIEGCYIEGEMSTTDKILAEKGTGSPADKLNFMSVWGYKVPAGYTIALGEGGVRTYNRGATMVNGERLARGTKNVTVKDCVLKNTRGGIALSLSAGKARIENCTLIGCQGSFSVPSGGVISNCRADAAFTPATGVAYEKVKGVTTDVTLMPYDGDPLAGNGAKQVAMIIGSGHNVTLRRGEGLKEDKSHEICIGGDSRSIGDLAKDENYMANNITLTNETYYPVVLGERATNVTVTSRGKVTDKGSGNTIIKLE